MLPRTAAQTGLIDRLLFCVEDCVVLRQQVRDLADRNLYAHLRQEGVNLGFTDALSIVLRQDQGTQPRSKLPMVPRWQGRQVRLPGRGGIVLLFRKLHIVGLHHHILHHHHFITLEFRVGWQERGVDRQHFFSVNLHGRLFLALLSGACLPPFSLRRMRGRAGFGGIPFDVGFILLAFEPVQFIAQALILRLRLTQVGGQLLDQIQQLLDQQTSLFVLDSSQIKIG
ncbi:MAG: hypothetical protein BWY63_02766 [Chloroflexi bacterium ADurb.Bin360]|nr:MAG: hypothetical protein BWY63_02766 [Chloroflexi bacterium ADurb.Bin360]